MGTIWHRVQDVVSPVVTMPQILWIPFSVTYLALAQLVLMNIFVG